jgi:hypothetical protein
VGEAVLAPRGVARTWGHSREARELIFKDGTYEQLEAEFIAGLSDEEAAMYREFTDSLASERQLR